MHRCGEIRYYIRYDQVIDHVVQGFDPVSPATLESKYKYLVDPHLFITHYSRSPGQFHCILSSTMGGADDASSNLKAGNPYHLKLAVAIEEIIIVSHAKVVALTINPCNASPRLAHISASLKSALTLSLKM